MTVWDFFGWSGVLAWVIVVLGVVGYSVLHIWAKMNGMPD